jgi:lipopolysaccharide transport system permease protein
MERKAFIPMLTIGLILWQFLSASLTEASGVFTRQANIIRNLNLPFALYPAQLILRQLINLAHNIPLFFVVVLVLGVPLSASSLMAIPGFILCVANLFWMVLLIGILGARYRDFEYLISMVMPLLMFLSPVMYRPNALPFSGQYIWFNPIASMIEVVRYPLLGEPTPDFIYWINIGMLVVGSTITVLFFNAKRNRIAFWV